MNISRICGALVALCAFSFASTAWSEDEKLSIGIVTFSTSDVNTNAMVEFDDQGRGVARLDR